MPSPEKAPVSCAPRSFLGLNVTTVGRSAFDRPNAPRKVLCMQSQHLDDLVPKLKEHCHKQHFAPCQS